MYRLLQYVVVAAAVVAPLLGPPGYGAARTNVKPAAQPAESVDQLLYDAVNGGMTAPDGSPRRALAKQFFDAMQESFRRKKAKQADILTWLIAALEFERKGVLKNIVTARLAGRKKRKSPHQLAGGPPAVIGEPAVFSHPA